VSLKSKVQYHIGPQNLDFGLISSYRLVA
jgi:hypothetical protein